MCTRVPLKEKKNEKSHMIELKGQKREYLEIIGEYKAKYFKG